MSIKNLIELGNLLSKPLGPSGRPYRRRTIVGADKGHWLLEYVYNESYGYSYEYAWERMTDEDMRMSRCYADDYTGVRV